jgi:phage repressor protein C with HTH and peptisase S24 domain
MLRLVSGIGDSMFPTLLDTDVMILDTSQRMLNMQDRIYAISLYGAGALKRLRAVGKNRILVISDNPVVEDQEVDAEDISIAGRLIGAFRRY